MSVRTASQDALESGGCGPAAGTASPHGRVEAFGRPVHALLALDAVPSPSRTLACHLATMNPDRLH